MKKIILFVLISKERLINNSFWEHGITVEDYNTVLNNIVKDCIIVITQSFYEDIPSVPDFMPGATIYVITEEIQDSSIEDTHIIFSKSFADVLEKTSTTKDPLLVIGEPLLTDEITSLHMNEITMIYELQSEQTFEGICFPQLNILSWQEKVPPDLVLTSKFPKHNFKLTKHMPHEAL